MSARARKPTLAQQTQEATVLILKKVSLLTTRLQQLEERNAAAEEARTATEVAHTQTITAQTEQVSLLTAQVQQMEERRVAAVDSRAATETELHETVTHMEHEHTQQLKRYDALLSTAVEEQKAAYQRLEHEVDVKHASVTSTAASLNRNVEVVLSKLATAACSQSGTEAATPVPEHTTQAHLPSEDENDSSASCATRTQSSRLAALLLTP